MQKSLNEVDKVIVSTDCKKIYKIAKKYEFNEKKLRDKKLSRKYSLTSEVIIKIIKENHLKMIIYYYFNQQLHLEIKRTLKLC